jgi:4-amino-4-deoxy-L-arabinose transferase-like glycosyltransferase
MENTQLFSRRKGWLERHSHALAAAILLLALIGYLYNLDSWRMYDDEGGYLYAAWRISEGEMPYRDFLTPQAPVFLYIGGAVMRLIGPSAIGLRLVTIGAMLLTAWLFYLVVKDTINPPIALLSLVVFLLHNNVYYMARFFRSEAYMVFFDLLGLYLGVQFYRRGKPWLAWMAGGAFALAMLAKLFGLLPFAGYMLFLFWSSLRDQGKWQLWRTFRQLTGPAIGFAIVSIGVLGPLYLINPGLYYFLVGHHVRQGVGLSLIQVFVNGLNFFWDYVLLWPIYVLLAMIGIIVAWRRRAAFPLATLFLAQLPTAGAFLFISRFLRPRILIFLAPAGSVLVVLGTAWVVISLSARLPSRAKRPVQMATGLLLAALALYPHVQQDYQISQRQDHDTLPVAQLLSEWVAPDECVLSDYPALNFYAQRKNTYLGAGLSGGAVWGNQIRGYMLARELESQFCPGRRWVVIDVSPATGHTMVGLHDYAWFLEFLPGAGFKVVDDLMREEQLLRVYQAPPRPLLTDIEAPLQVDLGQNIQLLGYHFSQTTARAGEPLALTLYWQAKEPIDTDYKVFIHLVNSDGVLRAQEDVRPRYGRFPTYLWMPGPVIADEHQLSLPLDLEPGTYALGVGLYPWPDGPRLPAVGADGARLRDDWIALSSPVTVK